MSRGQVALFLYGTLREDEALSGLLPKVTSRHPATVPGRLYYAPHTSGYPVLVPASNDTDSVVGEVVWLSLNDADVQYTILMEISSGYSATWCRASLYDGWCDALTFTWDPRDGVGERVPCDDWSKRTIGAVWHQCRECGAAFKNPNEADECEWDHDNDDMSAAMSLALQKEDR